MIGISFPLVERQMPKIDVEIKRKGVDQPNKRIFPVLQHGLHELCVRF